MATRVCDDCVYVCMCLSPGHLFVFRTEHKVNAYKASVTSQANIQDLAIRELRGQNSEVLRQVHAVQTAVTSLAASQQQQQAAAATVPGSFYGGRSSIGLDAGAAIAAGPSRRLSVKPTRLLSTLAGRASMVSPAGAGRGGGAAAGGPPGLQTDDSAAAHDGGDVSVVSPRAAGAARGAASSGTDGREGPEGLASSADMLAALQQQVEQQQHLIRLLAARLDQAGAGQ